MRITQVNPTYIRGLIRGDQQKTTFANRVGGLVQAVGIKRIQHATLGFADPSKNPESKDMLTQPEKVCKLIQEFGPGVSPKPPEQCWRYAVGL